MWRQSYPVAAGGRDLHHSMEALTEAINQRTRLLIINTPHNPTGTILKKQDVDRLAAILQNTDIFLISDEVYEHILFDQEPHYSILREPLLRERSFVMSSFGKTYHATGWKVGYCMHRLI
jgi:methionine aminotransferase